MTTQGKSLEELGRRAVACARWKWMPGMTILGSKGRRVIVVGLSGAPEATSGMNSRAIDPNELPDLSSPATLGCLLHLVRQAWGSDEWSRNVVPVFNGIDAWTVGCLDMQGSKAPRLLFLVNKINCMPVGIGSSEAEALVIALEAAP